MTMRVNGPGGVVVNFPDGTDPETINKVMMEATQKRALVQEAPRVNESTKTNKKIPFYAGVGDLAKSAGTGLMRGVAGLAGIPGDIRTGMNAGMDWLTGASPEQKQKMAQFEQGLAVPAPPASGQMIQGAQDMGVPFHEPQSRAGMLMETMGEYAPAAAAGPGSLVRKAAMTAVPAMATEAAGYATEGTNAEPYARMAGGLAGGVASAGRAGNAIKQIAKNAPSFEEVSALKTSLYGKLERAGVRYDSNEFQNFAAAMVKNLGDKVDKTIHPSSRAVMEKIVRAARQGKSPSFTDLENMRVLAGDASRGVDPALYADRAFAGKIKNALDDFADNSPLITNGSVPAGQVAPMARQARELASRIIKARDLKNRMVNAEGYQSGDESGLRNQFSSILKNPGQRYGKTPEELKAIKKVAKGTIANNLLGSIGRGGVNMGGSGNRSFLGPGLTGMSGATIGTALLGPVLGPIVGPAVSVGGASIAKALAARGTSKAAERAIKVVLSGKDAQKTVTAKQKEELRKVIARALLSGSAATVDKRIGLEGSIGGGDISQVRGGWASP